MHREDLITTIEMKDRNGNVIETREVVRYAGLLTRAHEEGLKKIETVLVQLPTEENGMVAVATAKVETEKGIFTATADATLANANRRMHRFLTALAETRAKARALRDAVNIGIVSLEEILGENGAEIPVEVVAEVEVPEVPEISPEVPTRTPARIGNGLMTDSQRRYLYRLLAEDGITGLAAQADLKSRFEVEDLKTVTKAQASRLIDELAKRQAG